MKKITKVAALLAAGVLLFGGLFASCSSSDDSDDNKTTTQKSGTPDPTPAPEPEPEPTPTGETVTYKAVEITEAEVALMKDKNGASPAAGQVTKLAEGTYSIWAGKGAIVTANEKMSIQINKGKTTPVSIVSATNMTGSTATAVPVVGQNIKSIMSDSNGNPITEDKTPVNYVKVATPATGKSLISLNISTDASSKELGAGLSYWILATDENGTILAVKDIGDIGGSVSYETQDVSIGTATLGENVCLGFARGAGSGGLKIHSITITKTAKSVATSNPAIANFAATACTTSDQNDGKITISNENVANLEYKLSTAESYTDVTSITLENLAAGTYLFRYKETDDTLASEAIEVVVEKYVDTSVYFTKFDAKDLYVNADGTAATADVNVEADKEASDGTWKLVIASSKKAQVKAGEFKTYDYDEATSSGYKWTNRLSFNKQGADNVALKLKVGAAKQVILRVDGGSVKDLSRNEYGESNLTFKGAGDAISWNPVVSLSTTYVTVTGDADGYVTINSTDTTNGANIYGITVVESKPATLPGAFELSTKLTTAAVYSKPVINAGYTAVATQGETLSATATLTQPTKSTATPVYADGSLGTATEGTETVEETAVTWTTTYGENVLTLGTGLSLAFATSATATDANYVPAGTYSVTASYKIGETAYTSDPISVQVKEAGATYVTVTFNANGGTDGTVTTQDVASGAATALKTVAELGLTAPSGKTFAGWALSADATEAVYTDGANITVNAATTLYAVWKEKGSSLSELDFSNLTSLANGTKGTFNALNGSTIYFSDSLKADSVKWTAKSSSIPDSFANPSKGMTLSAGKMATKSGTTEGIQNAVKIVTTGAATLTAYVTVQTSGNALTMDVYDSTFASIKGTTGVTYTFDGSTATLGSAVQAASDTTLTLHAITVTLPAAGTYYLGDTDKGKIQYGYLAVEM